MVEVVAALIRRGGKFLICQRPAHKARGLLWEFVGGKVEPGETGGQALIRECREELGVTISVGEVFMDVVHEYPDLSVHLTLYSALIAEGEPQLLEHNDIRWITPREAADYEFCPADVEILKEIQRRFPDEPSIGRPCVLITGAYGGMGKATAAALRERGWLVFALDRRVGEPQDGIVPIEADITDRESVENAFRLVRAETDCLLAILHFAGIYMLDSLVETDSGDFETIFRINVGGAFLVNKTFFPLLKTGSRIVITTSELAPLDPLPFTGIYAVTKSALDKYAYSLRMELQLLGIKVSVLRAGAVSTGMLGVSTDALDRFLDKTALYTCSVERFKAIVERVEARSIPPEKIAGKVCRILSARKPRFAYAINRNPLLLMMNSLPRGAQFFAIRQVLKPKL